MTIGPRMTLVMAIAAVIVSGWLAMVEAATEIVAPGGACRGAPSAFPMKPGWPGERTRFAPSTGRRCCPMPTIRAVEQGHSPVIVYEDGKPLGPAHSNFADISTLGHGRFAYWTGQGLIFSTSDGSDPNSNGRRYWAVVP